MLTVHIPPGVTECEVVQSSPFGDDPGGELLSKENEEKESAVLPTFSTKTFLGLSVLVAPRSVSVIVRAGGVPRPSV